MLTPRLVGERIGLNPLAVIFALLAFGQLFGFVGVLVALPASAVMLVALRRAPHGVPRQQACSVADAAAHARMKQHPARDHAAVAAELRQLHVPGDNAGRRCSTCSQLGACRRRRSTCGGPQGSGKTHLLAALAGHWQAQGTAGRLLRCPGDAPPWTAAVRNGPLVLVDRLRGSWTKPRHSRPRSRCSSRPAAQGVQWVAAGRLPPVDLPLRDDLRSRLGWGPVFALQPLDEAHTRAALRREADRRGIWLSDEVMGFLLTRFERDMGNLMRLLDRLDDFALAERRAVTVPLLKKMLAEREAA